MTKITYLEHNGTIRTVDLPDGVSLMDGALSHAIPGIDGDCGGACACATCHVYVDDEWLAKLSPMNELERRMIVYATDVNANSRLACQIKVSPALDGLIVRTPAQQY